MNFTLTTIRDLIEILAALGGVVSFLILLWLRGKFVPMAPFAQIVRRMDAVEAAVTKLDTQVSQVPTHADLTSLRDRIAEVGGDVKALATAIEGLSEQLSMLVQHHLQDQRRSR